MQPNELERFRINPTTHIEIVDDKVLTHLIKRTSYASDELAKRKNAIPGMMDTYDALWEFITYPILYPEYFSTMNLKPPKGRTLVDCTMDDYTLRDR